MSRVRRPAAGLAGSGSLSRVGLSAVATGLLVLGAGAGCTTAVPEIRSATDPLPEADAGPLKAHLHSGELVVFDSWVEDAQVRELAGPARRYDRDRREVAAPDWIRIPVDSVALLEVSRREPDSGRGAGLTLLASYTVLTGFVSVVCASDPKKCFGSCPTFYLEEDGEGERLVAEGFSSSVARALEATDVDDLRTTSRERSFAIRMRNEALETHAVRSLRVHAVAEPEGTRVFQTDTGGFRLAARLHEAVACRAVEGDCLEPIRRLDAMERVSRTDPDDLALREVIELEFPAPVSGAKLGVVIAARHSFVSTFLFYQTLAYLGPDAGAFLARLERGDAEMLERVRNAMGFAGRLEVEVMDPEGAWIPVGAVIEAGPLAADVHLLELPPRVALRDAVRVRLDLAQGFWRVEHVGLAELGPHVEGHALKPVAVEPLGRVASRDALESLLDPERYLVTQPGDHYRIEFELPTPPGGSTHDAPPYRLFLESTGYYYEWMRSEWLEEASPERTTTMLLDPAAALRDLAPAFKELEGKMEAAFWNSPFRR